MFNASPLTKRTLHLRKVVCFILYSITSLFGDSPFSAQVKKLMEPKRVGGSSGGNNGWPEVGVVGRGLLLFSAEYIL